MELGPGHHLQVGSRQAMSFGIAKSGLGAYTGNRIIFFIHFHSIFRPPSCVRWAGESAVA